MIPGGRKTNKKLWALILVVWVVGMLAYCNAEARAYLEVGIGKNGLRQDDWDGRESTGCMFGAGYTWEIDKRWLVDLAYRHNSQCTRGEGFDTRSEQSNDSVGVYLRFTP